MEKQCDLGLIGLGVMGKNLGLNASDRGFAVACYDKDQAKVEAAVAANPALLATHELSQWIACLKRPRKILLMVPAGQAVDAVLESLSPWLEPGDIVIDGGNSFFHHTEQREQKLAAQGIYFLGMGVSGGESGARRGPSLMPGGDLNAYEQVKPLLEAVAAKVEGSACVDYMGKGASGHFVKMVHNGIEYAFMQLIAETYHLMKVVLGWSHDEIAGVFSEWNETELNSYLIEITAKVLRKEDPLTGGRLIDQIRDVASQKGTGRWTVESALELAVAIPTIEAAVWVRGLSAVPRDRELASLMLSEKRPAVRWEKQEALEQLKASLKAGLVLAFDQGMALLHKASQTYGYGLHLPSIAKVWRGGCIIRARLLSEIWTAFQHEPELVHLACSNLFASTLRKDIPALRKILSKAFEAGVAVPALAASLSYYDVLRSEELPTSLIQAQRDYFGAHSYRRKDRDGIFHTEWEHL